MKIKKGKLGAPKLSLCAGAGNGSDHKDLFVKMNTRIIEFVKNNENLDI